jgi:hypothetical protein
MQHSSIDISDHSLDASTDHNIINHSGLEFDAGMDPEADNDQMQSDFEYEDESELNFENKLHTVIDNDDSEKVYFLLFIGFNVFLQNTCMCLSEHISLFLMIYT